LKRPNVIFNQSLPQAHNLISIDLEEGHLNRFKWNERNWLNDNWTRDKPSNDNSYFHYHNL